MKHVKHSISKKLINIQQKKKEMISIIRQRYSLHQLWTNTDSVVIVTKVMNPNVAISRCMILYNLTSGRDNNMIQHLTQKKKKGKKKGIEKTIIILFSLYMHQFSVHPWASMHHFP